MRTLLAIVVAASALSAAPAFAQTLPLVPPDAPTPSDLPERRETLSGALERADRRLEIVNRGTDLLRQNQGANGRMNATRDAAIDADTPRAARPGYSPWSMW